MMPIDRISDWEKRLARQDAFWENYTIDRPVVNIRLPNPDANIPPRKPKTYASVRDRWMDTEAVVQNALDSVEQVLCYGDALPIAWPNLGPEILSAFMGCELEYSEDTSWAIPNLTDWQETSHIAFSEDNFYWKKILEMTDALLEAGKGKYYTGFTDLHPGGDAIASFRDPLYLNFDMMEAKNEVKKMLRLVTDTYFKIFDFYYEKLKANGQAVTSWPGIVSSKKWYVPSNDFSCMISKEMFDDVFLPGIIEECQHMDANLYHLDGPTALTHLDSLLEIKELNAIQWVFGAGQGRATDWLHIYKRVQAAGKGLQIYIEPSEMETITNELKPEGIWLGVWVSDTDEADRILKMAQLWT